MTSRRTRWLVGFATGAALLVVGISISLIMWAEQESIEKINTRVAQMAPWLLLWRIGVFAILILYWNELTGWATNAFALNSESGVELARWRWRAATGLVLMDLVLVEDLIGRIQHALI